MSAAHTPGPWHAGAWEGFTTREGLPLIHDEACFIIAEPGENPTDWLADAILIAAAPDLLAALELAERQLVSAFGEPDGSPLSSAPAEAAIHAARVAIKRARP